MDPAAILGRVLDRPIVVLVRTVLDVYGRAPGGLLANGLAFAALFAAFPIVLLVLGVAGLAVADPDAQSALAAALKRLFPPLAEFVDQALATLSSGATAASILGLVGVVWAVSQFYVTLDRAFSRIFADRLERDGVRRTLRGFLWVILLIVGVVGLIVAGLLSTTVETIFPEAPDLIRMIRGTLGGWPVLFGLGVAVIAIVYRTVPPTRPSMRAIWLPAVLVGVAIVLLSQLFLTLAPLLVSAAALAGSLATAFIALAWLSFTFQALLYGAAWVRVRDEGTGLLGRPGGSALASPAAPAEPGGGGQ
jgi:YihY family inner membrane protein